MTLGGDLKKGRSGVISGSEQVTIPGKKGKIQRYLPVAGGVALATILFPGEAGELQHHLPIVGSVALAAVLFGLATTNKPGLDSLVAREAGRILRKYRKRIVQANPEELGAPGQEVVPLSSVEDLVRVSNELLKPMVYYAHANPGDSHIYYVVDGSTRYEFRLEDVEASGTGTSPASGG